jgi:polyhydroxyalkanoate synthesis regulator phasin
MLEHGQLPDPEAQEIDELRQRVNELEAQVRAIRDQTGSIPNG